ncbi:MAG: alpha/beta hydrolase [Bacteroidales bacterium]|nr:alpha/beta hydrolase [Bacteroidales bacterium]MCF8404371.1 alpha/beta hydrolase [Bacteroidales bacterium]
MKILIYSTFTILLLLVACQDDIGDLNILVPATVVDDPDLPQIEICVAGHIRSIHLETFGNPSNPKLFILHGSLGDYRAFLPYQILSDKYFVVMWDQRGSGLSERITKSEITYASMIEEIDAIKALYSPNEKINFFGHSFGAMYATYYCAKKPNNVNQVVLAEPGGLTGDIMKSGLDHGFKLNLFDEQLTHQFWQNDLLSAKSHEELDYKTMMLLHGNTNQYHCDSNNKSYWPVWRVGGFLELNRVIYKNKTPIYDFTVGLKNFQNKVLILGSSCSFLGYDFQVAYHKNLFADAEIVRFEECGHRLTVEKFDEILNELYNYLEEY